MKETFRSTSAFLRIRMTGIVTLAVAAALLYLAVPRYSVAYIALAAPLAIFDLQQGNHPSIEQLAQAEADIETSLSYGVETATLNSQLSYLTLSRLQLNDAALEKPKDLRIAMLAVEAALKRRPLDAYLWTRYTHLRYLTEGFSPYVVAALERSFLYGPREGELLQFRMTLCIEVWEKLPSSLQTSTLNQIELAAAMTGLWGRVLADLSDPARERLANFLGDASADIDKAQRIAASIQRSRARD